MKISLLQLPLTWADISANLTTCEQALLSAPQSDIYVFPEMFTTGFLMQPEDIVISPEDTLNWMKEMATKLDAAIGGSVAVKVADGDCRNRFYFVTPDSVAFYDKHHLFAYGGEREHYTPGDERVVVEWRGVRILLQVCYDLRFPVFSRNKAAAYDLALYVANWPSSRRQVWDVLLRARALENQCFVAGVNRVGDDPQCHYDGGSTIIDAYGKTLALAADDTSQAITATLDMQRLSTFRTKFPVLSEAD